ncbi:MAG: CoA transferase [Dehalococcoidia bacterium]|nr:CoA transferase [Dehalococcoidia bacterium]
MNKESPPLAGVRVLDFTWVWAGPYATMLLAMLGAEIIKIESEGRMDIMRRVVVWPLYEPYPREVPLNQGMSFNSINMNKLGITINLERAEGVELVRRLAAISDVVIDNMRAGTMDKIGLGYEDLRRVNPRIVMLSSSARGATGPEAQYAGYATVHHAVGGAAHITGYPDGPPSTTLGDVDLMNATTAAFAIVAALQHREQTGEGQFIDFSQCEGVSSLIGEVLLDYEMNGRSPGRMGNADTFLAPHNVYRCWGVDRWVAIAVETDEEFRALARVIGQPELADDPRFATMAARKANEAELDAIISKWTRIRERDLVANTLASAGIAAAPSRNAEELAHDPHLRARGAFVTVDHPEVGEREFVGAPWQMSGARVEPRAAPLLGQHNRDVFCDILRMDEGEFVRLQEEGVIW